MIFLKLWYDYSVLAIRENVKMVSIRFGADVLHAYHNVSDEVCTVYNVIFYPDN